VIGYFVSLFGFPGQNPSELLVSVGILFFSHYESHVNWHSLFKRSYVTPYMLVTMMTSKKDKYLKIHMEGGGGGGVSITLSLLLLI
jgi:hypothetical protein